VDAQVEGLFSQVIANPDRVAPREALASRLLAYSDPRGRFIHLQLAASRERKLYGRSEAYKRLRLEYIELENTYRANWTNGIETWASTPVFARGFVESVSVAARDFLANGAALYARAPIRGITLFDTAGHIAAVAECPLLKRLAALKIYDKNQRGRMGDEDLAILASSPYLQSLRLLDISFNEINNRGVEELCRHLPHLTYVNLAGTPADDVVEEVGTDPVTADNVPTGALPPAGAALEARYGRVAWLHAPSELKVYPPTIEDF
jgi:hypothetical protein